MPPSFVLGTEHLGIEQTHQRPEPKVLPSMWRARKEHAGGDLASLVQLFNQLEAEGLSGFLISVEVMSLVDDHYVPDRRIEQAVMASIAVRAQGWQRGDNDLVNAPEVGSIRVQIRVIRRLPGCRTSASVASAIDRPAWPGKNQHPLYLSAAQARAKAAGRLRSSFPCRRRQRSADASAKNAAHDGKPIADVGVAKCATS